MAGEKNFENRVKKYLQSIGIYPLGTAGDRMDVAPIGYYEKRWGGGYAKAGLPDMHIVANGISIDVELKGPAGKPSELQRHNIKQINASGSIALLLYPDGFDVFKELMGEVVKCRAHIPKLNALKAANISTSCAMLMD